MRGWYDTDREWREDLESGRVVELLEHDAHTDECSAAWERGEGCRCSVSDPQPEGTITETHQ